MTFLYKDGKHYYEQTYKTDLGIYPMLESILAQQQKGLQECRYLPNDEAGYTIPILLYFSMSGEPFTAFGNLGYCDTDYFGPFKTNFFRIEQLINHRFACLSLMRPFNEYGDLADSILDTYQLENTIYNIKVDLDKISCIQSANPKLVNRELLEIEQKC